ncbi:Acidic leucine-rich nuclear phosphoprotein 32 family member A [Chionoecetes opilio]|uniref:Acidic leucine-rich nuclear phosphoprotein 32 family member A n=1 Tax=Chionoecetes opilio TaxID=41210 RepID=A0A8J4Y6E1_CHIOP|nr:Acidic leucine-rich nuclear phosphoprotein 32 family member A [Chionoecetes opilio]
MRGERCGEGCNKVRYELRHTDGVPVLVCLGRPPPHDRTVLGMWLYVHVIVLALGLITELNLDNCKSTSILGLTEEFGNLEVLSLINVGLTTLKGFPALPKLRKLELSDNRISGGLGALTCLPKLSDLNLSGNRIKDLETLEPLRDLKSLFNLDLFNCEVLQTENYREKMFALVPSLVYLDGFDKEDNSEGEEDGEEEEDGVETIGEGDHEEDDGVVVEGDQDDDDDGGEEEEEIDEEEVEEEEDEEEEEDVALDALYKDYDPEGDDDYEAVEEVGEEEEAIDEDGEGPRGQKRKLEDGDDGD